MPSENVLVTVSHPVRGAWIEILISEHAIGVVAVAPREGCVD